MINQLEWDSNFFGINTGRLDTNNLSAGEVAKLLENAKSSRFQLIYIFTPHDEQILKKIITGLGGKLADEKVTYTMNIAGLNPLQSGAVHSCKGIKMDDDLKSLAIESGKYSRFRTDERIPRKKFEELYRIWMKNSLDGKFADEVFSYDENGKKLGMVTVDVREGEGWIGIIAVNEKSRGKSIGKLLMNEAIRFCKDNNLDVLNVQTQLENSVSCAFYEKIGFSTRNIEDVYHFWASPE